MLKTKTIFEIFSFLAQHSHTRTLTVRLFHPTANVLLIFFNKSQSMFQEYFNVIAAYKNIKLCYCSFC